MRSFLRPPLTPFPGRRRAGRSIFLLSYIWIPKAPYAGAQDKIRPFLNAAAAGDRQSLPLPFSRRSQRHGSSCRKPAAASPQGGLCPPAGSKKGPQRLLRAQGAAPAASCGAVRPGNSPFGKRRPLLSFCSLFEDGSTDWLICCTKSGIRLLSPAPQVQQPAAPRAKRCTAKPPPRKI